MFHYFVEDGKYISKLSLFSSWPSAMIKPPVTQANFHGSEDVQAIEDLL